MKTIQGHTVRYRPRLWPIVQDDGSFDILIVSELLDTGIMQLQFWTRQFALTGKGVIDLMGRTTRVEDYRTVLHSIRLRKGTNIQEAVDWHLNNVNEANETARLTYQACGLSPHFWCDTSATNVKTQDYHHDVVTPSDCDTPEPG